MNADNVTHFPKEFLNKLSYANIPLHELKLKVGAHVMILRNIHTPYMMNGTRAIISALHPNLIESKISAGEYKDESLLLPRIKFITDQTKTSF